VTGEKNRVDRDHANGLIDLLVFVTRAESAAHLDLNLHLELLLLVESADVLLRIDQFNILVELDVRGSHCAFLVGGKEQDLGM